MGLTKEQVIERLSVLEARAALDAAIAREEKETEKRNRAFAKLSNARKRVVVAEDVLAQLTSKRLLPRFGVYLEVDSDVHDRFFDDDAYKTQVHTALQGAKCQVCGIGSLFVAAVDRANNCTVGDMETPSDSSFMRDYLKDFFDMEQLVLIEAAFEGRMIISADTGLWEDSDKVREAIRFTRDVRSAEGRLKKIMQNIVDNKGTFKPEASES